MTNKAGLKHEDLFGSSKMETWEGEVVLITGATSGIGKEVAKLLAKASLKVFATGRSESKLEELKNDIHSFGGIIETEAQDLRKEDNIFSLFNSIRKKWGGVRILINNAGLGYKVGLLDENASKWREMLETNVLAPTLCAQQAIEDMRRLSDKGHVINLCSMAGHRVPPQGGMYSATKYAMNSLTEGLRQELRALKSNIRVSQISPGFVDTPFLPQYFGKPEESEKFLSKITPLTALDIARTVYSVITQPQSMQIHDILIRPTEQPN